MQDLGVLLWDNAIKRVMVVTKGGHDDVKRYWKRQKQSNSWKGWLTYVPYIMIKEFGKIVAVSSKCLTIKNVM